jgi:hypothetical protein
MDQETESAGLSSGGISLDMKKLSIVGKDYHTEERVIGWH